MKEKKDIDQYFKERFQDMKTTPPPAVWNRIEEQLTPKKKDRKIIPLWWQLGGVAALLLLALLVGGRLFLSPQGATTQPQVVQEDTIDYNTEIKNTETPSQTQDKEVSQQNQIATEDTTHKNSDQNAEAAIIPTTSSTQVAAQNNNPKSTTQSKPNDRNGIPLQLKREKNAITTTSEKDDFNKNTIIKKVINTTIDEASTIASVKKEIKEKPRDITSSETLTQESKQEEAIASQETVVKSTNDKAEENKPSILDAIKEQEEAVAEVSSSQKRWEVMPTLAPVYYNSLSEGSSIDPAFADNPQSGDVNVSYGFQVSYAINNRLKVRTGISNVNLSYGTSDLELATGDASAALQSINYPQRGIVTTAVDRGAIAQAAPGTPFANLTRKATDGEVLLTQNINYLEIPTELTYTVLDKKISLNVIGGFSTLFLGNNDISVAAGDFESQLGEANNLTDVSFSTNVGLGMRYNFSKRFSFNVEPIFKYQLNPYTNSAVSFQPYYVGVYSGLSFRF